jgi:hypothetical protein
MLSLLGDKSIPGRVKHGLNIDFSITTYFLRSNCIDPYLGKFSLILPNKKILNMILRAIPFMISRRKEMQWL